MLRAPALEQPVHSRWRTSSASRQRAPSPQRQCQGQARAADPRGAPARVVRTVPMVPMVPMVLGGLFALAGSANFGFDFAFGLACAQDRPSEAELFGGATEAPGRPSEDELFGGTQAGPDAAASANGQPSGTDGPARRPSEDELFGSEERSDTTIRARANAPPDARDAVLGGGAAPMFSEEPAPWDPLTIGGQIYLRLQSTANERTEPQHWGVSSPTLLDVFFDARPNDRVRGFARGRMSYDPLLPSSQGGLSGTSVLGSSGTAGSTSISPLYTGATGSPRVLLDQLWLRFDIARQLFVSVGKQHVRWGTGRFWMPADYLHLLKRNPLDIFDVRTGTNMIKVHLPIESLSWNFYAYGVLQNAGVRPDLGTLAGALRAEFVWDQLELAIGAYGSPDTRAKFAADVSFGLGDVDFYGELALRDGREIDRVRYAPDASLPPRPDFTAVPPDVAQALAYAQIQQEVDALYPVYRDKGYRPQVVAGFSYSRKYNDSDTFSVGMEYFYNGFGYDSPDVYSGLLWPHSQPLQNAASFFYFGRHYAALFATFPAPFKLDLHTFTVSTLGNLSDRTFTTRVDYAYTLLTHLRLEAYASVAYGGRGEFRFRIADLPSVHVSELGLPRPTVVALGLGLRLAI